jgi:cold shock CspA family protein/arsenate reductase-like glutaredoxin family protein
MSSGTVKFFNAGKGFGFITSDAGNKDIFVPSASLTASGISSLKPGQRVSFEELPDGKGPKAVNLSLLSEAPRPPVLKEGQRPQQTKARSQLTYYHDHTSEWSSYVLTTIRALGHEPVVVRYRETSPAKDQLRGLSRLLGSNGQNLVRRYDPLFLDLQLDDRFIGDNEYWEAIMEHPILIDGPLLATEIKASLCHSDDAVAKFFAETPSGTEQSAAKPKGLSARALQILTGDAVPAALKVEVAEAEKGEVLEESRAAAIFAQAEANDTVKLSRKKAEARAPVKTQSRAKAPSKNASEVKAKAVARPKPKPAASAKSKKSPKSAVRKISKSR